MNMLSFEFPFNLMKDLKALRLMPYHDFGNGLKQFFCRLPSKHTFPLFPCEHNTLYGCIPDFEKLIQVVRKDPQEPQSLNQGNAWICTFLQHALIEQQPTDLSIDISVLMYNH